ncbi:Carotenoid cleavage dioxygenase 7, partial [Gracilaria domingensis]
LSNPLSFPIDGKLPAYVAGGAYFRIGPGLFEATHADGAPYALTHWFDGLAVLHKFAFASEFN